MRNFLAGWKLVAAVISASISSCDSSDQISSTGPPVASDEWTTPECLQVEGASAFSFSTNSGQSFAVPRVPLDTSTNSFSSGISAYSGLPNTIVGFHEGMVFSSTDSGCTWINLGTITGLRSAKVALGSTRDLVFAWQINNGDAYHISGIGTVRRIQLPTDSPKGFAVSKSRGEYLFVGGRQGQLFLSPDAGRTWQPYGVPPPLSANQFVNTLVFVADNDKHVFLGTQDEAYVTFDGGTSWLNSTGIGLEWTSFNVVGAYFAESQSDIIWIVVNGLNTSTGAVGTAILRSDDGGQSFSKALSEQEGLVLRSDPIIAVAPMHPNIIVIGSDWREGQCGLSTITYDHDSGLLIRYDSLEVESIGSLAVSPASDSIVYVGAQTDSTCH